MSLAQLASTGSCSGSRSTSPTPTSTSLRPRRRDIDLEDISDPGEAVRGEGVAFLFLLAFASTIFSPSSLALRLMQPLIPLVISSRSRKEESNSDVDC